jgi:hypothetical protein
MMATDFHPRARFDFLGIAQADFSSAQVTSTPWATVVAIHENDIALWVYQ